MRLAATGTQARSCAIAPRAPARRATPDGITSYRISAGDCVRKSQTRCNSPDDRRKIFVPKTRCDGPRSRILPPRPNWFAVPSIAGDTVGTAPGDALGPLPSADSAAQPAIATIAGLPGSNPHCNSGSKDAMAESTAHTPSADNAANGPTTCDCYQRRPLDQNPNSEHAEMGPREVLLPTGQVSEEERLLLFRGAIEPLPRTTPPSSLK